MKSKTSAPTWNQVLKIQRMMFITIDRINNSPPVVMVEIYDNDVSIVS